MAIHTRHEESSWVNTSQRYRNDSQRDWGYPDASRYSRDNYAHRRSVQSHRSHGGGIAKKILIAIVAVVVLLAIGIFAYAAAFNAKLAEGQSTPTEMQNVLTPAAAGEPYYILLLGSDWREYSGTSDKAEMSGDQQRSDVIILCRMDAANKQVTMVSVPRDTRWTYQGKIYKINEAYNIGGAALETQAISELTGVPIAHTLETHFSGVQGLVDALGGVKVYVPQTIKYTDALTGEYVTVEQGEQVLNGQQAQIFARVRKAYTDGDGTRQSNVRVLVSAIVDGILEKPFFEYPALGLQIASCFGTDMNLFDFIGLAKDYGTGYTLYSGTGPTEGDFDETQDGLWLCYENPEGWKRVMDVVNAGGDPSTVDPNLETQGAVSGAETGWYDEYGNYYEGEADYSEDYSYEEDWG